MANLVLKRPKGNKSGEGGSKFELLPEGKYRVVTENVEEVTDQWGGLKCDFTVVGGDYANKNLTGLRVFPDSPAARSFAEAMDFDPEAAEAEFDLNEVVGLEFNLYLKQKESKKTPGQFFNVISRFAAVPAKRGK